MPKQLSRQQSFAQGYNGGGGRLLVACSSPADVTVLVTDEETNLGNGRLQGKAADVRVAEVGGC